MSKCYCIKEYGYFASDKYTDKVTGQNILLPHKVFEKIEEVLQIIMERKHHIHCFFQWKKYLKNM